MDAELIFEHEAHVVSVEVTVGGETIDLQVRPRVVQAHQHLAQSFRLRPARRLEGPSQGDLELDVDEDEAGPATAALAQTVVAEVAVKHLVDLDLVIVADRLALLTRGEDESAVEAHLARRVRVLAVRDQLVNA